MILEILKKIVEYDNSIKEATNSTKNSLYISTLTPGYREFEKNIIAPFTEYVTDWDDALLDYDSLDGEMSQSRKTIKKRENRAEKIATYIKNNPDKLAQEDGGLLNTSQSKDTNAKPIKNFNPKKTIVKLGEKTKMKNKGLKESTGTMSSGTYRGPLSPGLKLWDKNTLEPYIEKLDGYENVETYVDALDGNINTKNVKTKEIKAKKLANYDKKHPVLNDDDGSDLNDNPVNKKLLKKVLGKNQIKEEIVNEDLGVWFGTKKKPKGSSQPKGPWVNICSKKDGKHPPCGRPEGDEKSYPKCRAVGVAAKMTDSEKQAACQQKRNAEKKDTQTGKGQKPIMTSYKPKKKKTNESVLISLIRKALD